MSFLLIIGLIFFCILWSIFITRALLKNTKDVINTVIFWILGLIFYYVIKSIPIVKMYIFEPIANLEQVRGEFVINETKHIGLICGILILTILSLTLLKTEIKFNSELNETTLVILILIAIFGYISAMVAETFFYLYLSLELAAFSTYTLVGASLSNLRVIEGAIKYYLGTSLTSLFFLLGIAITFSKTGTMNITQVAEIFAYNTDLGLISGIVLILIGLISKLALAPLHWFTLDTYESITIGISSFLITVPKVALLSIIFSIFCLFNHMMISIIAIIMILLTLFLLSIQALGQYKLKRFIIFSMTINNALFLVPLLMNNQESLFSINQALFTYLLSFILLLYIAASLRKADKQMIDRLELLPLIKNSLIKFGLLVSAITLSGLPVFAAFFVKFLIYSQLIAFQEFLILVPLVLLTLIPIYYYIRFAQLAFLTKHFDPLFNTLMLAQTSKLSAAHIFIFCILIILNLVILSLQIFPSYFM